MKEKGLTNEGRHHLLYLHKQMHDKRGIIKSLIQYINQVLLPVCEVGVRWVIFGAYGKAENENRNRNWKIKTGNRNGNATSSLLQP